MKFLTSFILIAGMALGQQSQEQVLLSPDGWAACGVIVQCAPGAFVPGYEPDLLLIYPKSLQENLEAIGYVVIGIDVHGVQRTYSGWFPANASPGQANHIDIYAGSLREVHATITELTKSTQGDENPGLIIWSATVIL